MKNLYLLFSATLILASCGPTRQTSQSEYYESAPVQDVSYQSFYDQLSPYGNWVNYPGYGYVWMPNAGPDFRPYATNGNWIYTNAGWTWASNYNWGWAPFHYGRWFYENGYGWMWIPGNEWAPAWVSWRGGGDYYGWAPLGPRVSMDVALSSYNPPTYYWNFVPRQYMGNPGWHNYYVNESRNVTIINNTTIINNYSGTDRSRYAYAPGPDPNEVRRVSGNNFTAVQIREANTPGERISGNQYAIYHPRVTAAPAARGNTARPATPAPARYESFNNLRPSTQYPAYNNQPANNLPAANPRPAVQNPNTSQPVTNPRPAVQNTNPSQPAANQPVNDPRSLPSRPAQSPNSNQPVNPEPATNPRPAAARPAQNLNENQPITNPRAIPAQPQNPNFNQPSSINRQLSTYQKPALRNQSGKPHNPSPATSQKPAFQNPDNRVSHPAAPQQTPAQNRNQTTARPATTHNPATTAPVQRSNAPQTVPAEKQVEKPKVRETNGQ